MESQIQDLADATLNSYRAALRAVGESGALAHPLLGEDLQRQLITLQQSLAERVTPDLVRHTEHQLEGNLQHWAERTAEYFKQKTAEVKEILLLMASAAESVSARDERYTAQLTQISTDLEKVSNLEDLTAIRKSLGTTSADLNRCVVKMQQDGRETVQKLRSEIQTYQARVIEVERIASVDWLTGLANRREVERQLEHLIELRKPFCVMIFDLNRFKLVNDQFGHAAGDDLLKQFGAELRRFFRALDTVGRWGGDEFIVLLSSDLNSARSRLNGLEKWLYGDYTVETPTGPQKVAISAVSGVVEWSRGESATQVVARADAAMYKQKKAATR